MQELLIVSSSQKTADSLRTLLVPRFYQDACVAASAARARRELSQRGFRLVLINTPLSDEVGDALAGDICQKSTADVVLLASGDRMASQDSSSLPIPVLVLEKPLNRTVLEKTLQVLQVAQWRNQKLLGENKKLQAKLEESRLVGRAKCALIAYRQMTEEQAHHYIERAAMDSRQPKKEIARDILRTYDG
ncbi:ANTAR domain-containing protein [Ruminococcaceae bacterium OttesenSCG-928-A16]|nr:ANTAR domain-containing protein [Ruminococcaceae bacterium OttesenSCG-928-A16]